MKWFCRDLSVHCLTFDSLKCSAIYFQPVCGMRPPPSPSSPTRGPYIPCLRCMWDSQNNIWDSCLYINLSNIVVLTFVIVDAGVRNYTSSFTNYDWPQISSLQVYADSLMGCVKCAQYLLWHHAAQDTKKMSEITSNAKPYIYERLSIYLKWKCRSGNWGCPTRSTWILSSRSQP